MSSNRDYSEGKLHGERGGGESIRRSPDFNSGVRHAAWVKQMQNEQIRNYQVNLPMTRETNASTEGIKTEDIRPSQPLTWSVAIWSGALAGGIGVLLYLVGLRDSTFEVALPYAFGGALVGAAGGFIVKLVTRPWALVLMVLMFLAWLFFKK